MKREKSCGAVVYRESRDGTLYLLLQDRKTGSWGFAKGHVEADESEEATALRETEEESGLTVEFLAGFRERITYQSKPSVSKEVILFLAESASGEATINNEISGFAWLPYEAAHDRLTFKDTKKVLEKAHAFLTSSPGS